MKEKCQAKDPANCRYHSPNAAATLKLAVNKANADYKHALYQYMVQAEQGKTDDRLVTLILETKTVAEKAQTVYYGTEEGRQELIRKIDSEEDLNSIAELQAKLKRSEELKQATEEANKKTVPPLIAPSHFSDFIIPTFEKTYSPENKNILEQVGNRYHPTHTVNRIKTFVKQDLRKAQKEGYLPENIKFTIEHKPKTEMFTIKVDTNGEELNDMAITRIRKVSEAYSKKIIDLSVSEPDKKVQQTNYTTKLLVK